MRLDKVGARILQTESQLYQDRYTVGVFETITNSDFYQAHLKKENYKKIVDAFTVETQSLDDIHFGNDLAIAPNFPVSSLEFEKGKTCTISSLGYKSMSLESKRPPKVSAKEVFNFQFPEVPGLPKGMAIKYVVSGIKFNKQTEKYETQFRLEDNDISSALWKRRDPILDDNPIGGGIATPIADGVISIEFEAYSMTSLPPQSVWERAAGTLGPGAGNRVCSGYGTSVSRRGILR